MSIFLKNKKRGKIEKEHRELDDDYNILAREMVNEGRVKATETLAKNGQNKKKNNHSKNKNILNEIFSPAEDSDNINDDELEDRFF